MYIDTENGIRITLVDGQVVLQYEVEMGDSEATDEPCCRRKEETRLFATPTEAARFVTALLTQWLTGKDEEQAALGEIYGAKKK